MHPNTEGCLWTSQICWPLWIPISYYTDIIINKFCPFHMFSTCWNLKKLIMLMLFVNKCHYIYFRCLCIDFACKSICNFVKPSTGFCTPLPHIREGGNYIAPLPPPFTDYEEFVWEGERFYLYSPSDDCTSSIFITIPTEDQWSALSYTLQIISFTKTNMLWLNNSLVLFFGQMWCKPNIFCWPILYFTLYKGGERATTSVICINIDRARWGCRPRHLSVPKHSR